MLSNDLAPGNVITGPTGDLVVGGTIQTDQGLFLVLTDATSGLGALAHPGVLIENEEWTLKSRLSPDGNSRVAEVGETEALRSEVQRLGKLTDALIAERPAQSPEAVEAEPTLVDPNTVNDPLAPTPPTTTEV